MEIIDCNNSECILYQVKGEDGLSDILARFTNFKMIRNNPNVDLYEGEIIKLIKHSNKLYIVKPMDTLSDIAKKYNTTIENLIDLNNLSSTRLFIGQSLMIDNKTLTENIVIDDD